jgi:hypothetical protein
MSSYLLSSNPLLRADILVPTAVVLGVSALYAALSFPSPPRDKGEHSLAELPQTSPHWRVYPPDFYPGGAYVDLPYGRVRYWRFGPEDGKRVRRFLVETGGFVLMIRCGRLRSCSFMGFSCRA